MKRKLMYLGGSILIASALCAAFVAAFFTKSDSEHEVVYEYSATCCQGFGENRGIGLRHYLQKVIEDNEDKINKVAKIHVLGMEDVHVDDNSAVGRAMRNVCVRWGRADEKSLRFSVSARSYDVDVADMVVDAYLKALIQHVSSENSRRKDHAIEQVHMHAEKARLLLLGLRRVEEKLRSQLPDSSAVVRQEIEDAKKEYEQLVREEERIRRAVAEWDVVLIPCGVTTNITAKAVNRGM